MTDCILMKSENSIIRCQYVGIQLIINYLTTYLSNLMSWVYTSANINQILYVPANETRPKKEACSRF